MKVLLNSLQLVHDVTLCLIYTKNNINLADLTYANLTYDGGIRQFREELAPAAAEAEAEGLVRGLGIARSRIHVMQQ